MSGAPDPKSRSLARGERRRFRKVATKAEWKLIVKEKAGPCRVCVVPSANGHGFPVVSFHHLVPRSLGGDDVAANIVPLCGDGVRGCHGAVEARLPQPLAALAASLTDSEYAYVISKLGESGPARLFGVGR